MKSLIRVGCGSLLLVLFSAPGFAWGVFSGWVNYDSTKYCFAMRGNSSLTGQVRQEARFECDDGFCVDVGTAYVENVTSTTQAADLRLQSKRSNRNELFADLILRNVPAFTRSLSLEFDTGDDGNFISRCSVQ